MTDDEAAIAIATGIAIGAGATLLEEMLAKEIENGDHRTLKIDYT